MKMIFLFLRKKLFWLIILLVFPNTLLLNAQTQHLAQYLQKSKTFKPLHFQIDSSLRKDKEIIEYISFENPHGLLVKGYIIRPQNTTSFPVVIYQHNEMLNKDQFFQEALAMAENGIICAMIDAPQHCKKTSPTFDSRNYDFHFREGVLHIQLLLDILEEHYTIDRTKIAFVGHSFGANLGAILSVAEPRISHFVLMACPAQTAHLYFKNSQSNISKTAESTPKERFDLWLGVLENFDAVRYLPQTNATIYFQFALLDALLSQDSAHHLYQITPETKYIQFYKATHDLNDTAMVDRILWILKNLKK